MKVSGISDGKSMRFVLHSGDKIKQLIIFNMNLFAFKYNRFCFMILLA